MKNQQHNVDASDSNAMDGDVAADITATEAVELNATESGTPDQQRIAALEAQLIEAQQQVKESTLRTQAEIANIRRRTDEPSGECP